MDISGMKVQMGFSLKSPQPLDARSVVETKDDLDSLVSSSWAYDGMVVYVKTGDDKGLYVYEANETSGVWTKVGSDAGGSGDIDLSDYVPITRTVNGKPLSSNISLAASDVKALPNFSLNINHGTAGNPRQVKFLTVDYANYTGNSSAYFKLSATSCHGNGSSYQFLEDIIIGVAYNSANTSSVATIVCNVFKYCQQSCGTADYNLVDGLERYYGDVFYVHDSTNKIIDFYILCGQYASSQFTPITKIGSTTTSGITQHTGTATYHKSGTRNWANGNATIYAVKSDIPTLISQLTNDSGFVTKAEAAPEIIDLTE